MRHFDERFCPGHYRARAMPSAGVYPWFRSLICDLQNPCFSSELPSEVPGQINEPNRNKLVYFDLFFVKSNF